MSDQIKIYNQWCGVCERERPEYFFTLVNPSQDEVCDECYISVVTDEVIRRVEIIIKQLNNGGTNQ